MMDSEHSVLLRNVQRSDESSSPSATVSAAFKQASITRVVFVLLLALCLAGNILVWSSASLSSQGPAVSALPFFNILLAAVLFTFCTVQNATIPSKFSGVVRKFSTVLLASNLDTCLCTCHALVSQSSSNSLSGEALTRLYMLRWASSATIAGAIGTFLVASCSAGVPVHGFWSRARTLKNAVALLAGVLTLTAQVVIWSVRDLCSYLPGGLFFSPSVPFIVGTVTVTAHAFDVKPVQDMALVFFINFILVALPIFDTNDGVSLPESVLNAWRWSTCIIFGSSILYVCGVLSSTFRNRRTARYDHCDNRGILSKIAHLALAACGFAGAVMAFSVTPSDNLLPSLSRHVVVYEAAIGALVPLLCLWSEFSKFDGAHLVALILSVICGGQLVYPTQLELFQRSSSLYTKSAFVLLSVSVVASPLLRFAMPAADARPMSASPKSSAMTVLLCFVCAAWSFTSGFALKQPYKWPFLIFPSICQFAVLNAYASRETNAQRVFYFFAMLFSLNAAVWPLADQNANPAAVTAALAACGLSAVTVYSLDTPGAFFSVVHATQEQQAGDGSMIDGASMTTQDKLKNGSV